ncbi:MAG: BrnT family toxin [Candidatus Tectomicrobia bacterium]|nr:BrnT family toxin [Candidatus Tectomicrobia bacterium]
MKIHAITWLEEIVHKIQIKHNVDTWEVKEVFGNRPRITFVEKGHQPSEDLYLALGQSDEGRYLAVLFLYKMSQKALIITARDMTHRERRSYGRKK